MMESLLRLLIGRLTSSSISDGVDGADHRISGLYRPFRGREMWPPDRGVYFYRTGRAAVFPPASFRGTNGRSLQAGGLVQQVLEVVGVTDEMRLYRR